MSYIRLYVLEQYHMRSTIFQRKQLRHFQIVSGFELGCLGSISRQAAAFVMVHELVWSLLPLRCNCWFNSRPAGRPLSVWIHWNAGRPVVLFRVSSPSMNLLGCNKSPVCTAKPDVANLYRYSGPNAKLL